MTGEIVPKHLAAAVLLRSHLAALFGNAAECLRLAKSRKRKCGNQYKQQG